jgi:hypothetical protein
MCRRQRRRELNLHTIIVVAGGRHRHQVPTGNADIDSYNSGAVGSKLFFISPSYAITTKCIAITRNQPLPLPVTDIGIGIVFGLILSQDN